MTDCDRLLEALKDGAWHSHAELYALGLMVHSRAANLRQRGHTIHVRREWSRSQRRNFYFYRLDSLKGDARPGVASPLSEDGPIPDARPIPSVLSHPVGPDPEDAAAPHGLASRTAADAASAPPSGPTQPSLFEVPA
jgi:hypothetical protein